MKALAVLMILLGLLAMLRFGSMDSQDVQRTEAIAHNFAVYRNEVHRYVFKDHKTPGDIATASLDLPTGWVMLRPWHARIEAGCLYVWGEASPEEIAVVRDLYWGSYAIGRAAAGQLVPSYGGVTPVPAFVSEGNIVSVVSVE
ncbi:type IV pilus biogenesis protein PilM [Solidesulfovibrio carbinolicus]|uniref:Pilus assembly protein PilM n=1 Tax=Solidesulfovibrio carbinolicus TaxID=296842 RepID=A0A4P6HIC5_9BACT|nr:type IV pilus biogenesis protein PilM [Solidesulfovibrio carbinolicus]QAZ66124.1 pilus assembly protein PilM [Solidesulfovibrio carbinolicus]